MLPNIDRRSYLMRNHGRVFGWLVGLAVAGFAGSCSGISANGDLEPFDDQATDTFWRLVSIGDTQPQNDDGIVRITSSSIDLSLSCYQAYYPFQREAGALKIFPPFSHGGRCDVAEAPHAREFNTNIYKVTNYRLSGAKLDMLSDKGEVLFHLTRFVSPTIEFHKWHIASYFNGTRLVSISKSSRDTPYITFIRGMPEGTPGCGEFVGDYSLSGQRININVATFVTGYCPDDNGLSGTIEQALQSARVIEQEANRILLKDSGGQIQVVLVPWA